MRRPHPTRQLLPSRAPRRQARWAPGTKAFTPVPTWVNHINIYRDAGVEQGTYRYCAPDPHSPGRSGSLRASVRPG